jgi:hypothetical protein
MEAAVCCRTQQFQFLANSPRGCDICHAAIQFPRKDRELAAAYESIRLCVPSIVSICVEVHHFVSIDMRILYSLAPRSLQE